MRKRLARLSSPGTGEGAQGQKREPGPWLAAAAISTCAVVNVLPGSWAFAFSPAFPLERAAPKNSLVSSRRASCLFDRTGSRVLFPPLNESLFADSLSLSLLSTYLLNRRQTRALSVVHYRDCSPRCLDEYVGCSSMWGGRRGSWFRRLFKNLF